MKRLTCLAALCLLPAAAQEPPASVIYIYREQVRPGKIAAFTRIEEGAAQSCARMKCPNPYIAISSVSGPSEFWWINGFESNDAMERVQAAYAANQEIMKELNSVAESKGDLVFPAEVWLARFREDLSGAAGAGFVYSRYLSISIQHVRPGQMASFEKARQRPRPGRTQWIYQVMSGTADNTFLVILGGRTMQEVMDPPERRASAAGDLLQVDLDSSVTRLFVVTPSMSMPAQSWVESDPEFWKRP
ncbi:MAG TPA: hypothetical protein VMT15_04880 [Bryobacteraceae bacterium]|nr:hypothetical protein [Bryobacteraceae bacterium]